MPQKHIPILNLDDPQTIAKEIYKRNLELNTERKRVENLLYNVSEGIIAIDQDYKITLFNRTLELITKYKYKEVIGKHVNDVITLENNTKESIQITKLLSDKKNTNEVYVITSKENTFYVRIRVSKIETQQGYVEYLITITDITKEKQLDKAKDEFISITSHELKTPLTIIKSYLWMLDQGKGGELNIKQKDYLQKAMNSSERLIILINDMLNVSRIEQGKIMFKPVVVNLNKLLNEVYDELKIKANEKNLKFELYTDPNGEFVITDKQKLTEVILNLGGNAIKYTDKGKISITTEKLKNGFVKLCITDTGRGIAKEEITKLFHKFQRLDNSYQTIAESGGTGLGLYIVKLYMNNLGGNVGVDSKGLKHGSTFWVTIPTDKKHI